MRQHLDEHNTIFNNFHTELLLNNYQLTNNELESTKQSLQKTKQELQKTNLELQKTNEDLKNTNLELQETKEALEESNEKINALDEKLIKCIGEKNEFEEKMMKMKNIETLQLQKCFTSIEESITVRDHEIKPIGTFETLLPLLDENDYLIHCKQAKEKHTPEYNGQQYNFISQQHNNIALSYEERMGNLLQSMDVGHVYHVNEKECYFKLKIKKNVDENYYLYFDFHNVRSIQQSWRNNLVLSLIHI